VNLAQYNTKILTQRRRAPVVKLIVPCLVQKLTSFSVTHWFITVLPMPPAPSSNTGATYELESFHTLPHHVFRICFNLLCLPCVRSVSILAAKNLYASHFLCTCSMNSLVKVSQWCFPNRVIWSPFSSVFNFILRSLQLFVQ
jgi:hypothetical protein